MVCCKFARENVCEAGRETGTGRGERDPTLKLRAERGVLGWGTHIAVAIPRLLAALLILIGVNDQVALLAIRPDEKQNVFPSRLGMNLIDEAVGVLNRMTVDPQNHNTRRKTRILSRAARAHRLNDRALHVFRHVELLAQIGSEVRDC